MWGGGWSGREVGGGREGLALTAPLPWCQAVLQETGGVGADYLVECLPADEVRLRAESAAPAGPPALTIIAAAVTATATPPFPQSESEKEALELLGTLVRCLAPHGHVRGGGGREGAHRGVFTPLTTHAVGHNPPRDAAAACRLHPALSAERQLVVRVPADVATRAPAAGPRCAGASLWPFHLHEAAASALIALPPTSPQGRLLHVMHDLMEKLAAGKLSPPPATAREVPLKHAADAFRELCEAGRGFLLVSPTPAGAE